MKRIVLLAVSMVCLLPVMAQSRNAQTLKQAPPEELYTLKFMSQHGESYSVYVDGELKNLIPQSQVIVNNISSKEHEVVVILKRPADKAAVLRLLPQDATVVINVNYDERLEDLYLYTPAHNRADKTIEKESRRLFNVVSEQQSTSEQLVDVQDSIAPVAEDVLAEMLRRMKSQSFDSERLSLGKVIVSSSTLTAEQIGQIVATIDFSNSQVELLKYAYSYCIDKANYYKAIDVLTFSSDKKRVVDYIATLK